MDQIKCFATRVVHCQKVENYPSKHRRDILKSNLLASKSDELFHLIYKIKKIEEAKPIKLKTTTSNLLTYPCALETFNKNLNCRVPLPGQL